MDTTTTGLTAALAGDPIFSYTSRTPCWNEMSGPYPVASVIFEISVIVSCTYTYSEIGLSTYTGSTSVL